MKLFKVKLLFCFSLKLFRQMQRRGGDGFDKKPTYINSTCCRKDIGFKNKFAGRNQYCIQISFYGAIQYVMYLFDHQEDDHVFKR